MSIAYLIGLKLLINSKLLDTLSNAVILPLVELQRAADTLTTLRLSSSYRPTVNGWTQWRTSIHV